MKNLSVILAIAKNDLLLWKKTPFAIYSAVIPPMGMMIVLVTLSLAVLQQPIALVVEGHGKHSLRMQKIIQSDTDAYLNHDFSEKISPVNKSLAQEMLNSQRVAAIITIPKDFDKQVEIGNAKIMLTLNNIDIDFADDIRRSVNRSVAHFDAPILSPNDAEEEGVEFDPEKPNSYLISIDEKDLRETNVEWLHYQVIPTLILLVLSVGLVGTSLLCGQDIERKTSRHLLLSPQNTTIIILGRILGGVIVSLIALSCALFTGLIFGFIDPPPGHWPALMIIFIATAFCASGLGAFIGTLFKDIKVIVMASSVVATYMYFLGGGFTTIAFLPEWLQNISQFIPFRYAIDGIRQALFYTTLDGVLKDIIILSITGIFSVILGTFSLKRAWSN